MPIGADLTLNETPDPESVRLDAAQLGAVVERTARRYSTPLAFPLMDLTLEKADLLAFLGVPADKVDAYHFDAPPEQAVIDAVLAAGERDFPARSQAAQGAIRYIAIQTDLVPVGMLIGPFSLMTKLVADPISGVALAGEGMTAEEEPGIQLIERALQIAEATVLCSARAQIAAGARALIVCEPAANRVYISPRQLKAGATTFERYVLTPNLRLRALLDAAGADLIFHDCGELSSEMVGWFAHRIHPCVLSLGGSRTLWEDAALVPKDVVLFGNLPTKIFYSDAAMPIVEVERRTRELVARMRECGHPHILGSECDVLHVPEAAATIRRKVDAMLNC
jgi:uroporphyrinogen-III decarboxylase